MKITFLRPNMLPVRGRDAMEPLVFAILAGLTPPDVETVLYDDRLEPIPFDEPTDLAALTVETYTARRAYQIAAEYRRRGVPVVMGGYHPTFLPEEALEHADAVVVGDADALWPRLVEDARRGRLQRIYRDEGFPPLAGAQPDRSIFRGKRYAPAALVQYGRGCRFACEFCSIHAFYGKDLRQRPVENVVAEIEATGKKHIFLVDDNIFVDRARAKELFTALIPLKIRWSCQISIDIAQDRELMALLERSGCTTAVVGFESLSESSLRQMKKHWNLKHSDYKTSVQIFQDHGIMLYGSFVFGYDDDTPDSFDRTLEFAVDSKFYTANFNPLTPMPGAALYDRLEKEGRLLYPRWWLDPRFRYGDAVFRPKGMSAEELTAGCYRIRKEFHSLRSIASRGLEYRTNCRDPYRLGLHLASNLVSRWMIDKKQGLPLGEMEQKNTDLHG